MKNNYKALLLKILIVLIAMMNQVQVVFATNQNIKLDHVEVTINHMTLKIDDLRTMTDFNQHIQKCIQDENYVELEKIKTHIEHFFVKNSSLKKQYKKFLEIEWAGLHLYLGQFNKADHI